MIPEDISSLKSNILCLYTSFQTASDVILRDSTIETQEPTNQAKTLENFERINFLLICQNIGILSLNQSYIYTPVGVFFHICSHTYEIIITITIITQ
ncbi:hypothetical protein GW891_03890 [bacterium]|nr:hypothetical protein [bacterium]